MKNWTTVKEWDYRGALCEIKRFYWSIQSPLLRPYHTGYARLPGPFDGADVANNIDVHGGVTYHRESSDGTETIGFDCYHSDDENNPQLMDVDWLTSEVERMVDQLIARRDGEGGS